MEETTEIRISGGVQSHHRITEWPYDLKPVPGYDHGDKIIYIDKIKADGHGLGTKEIQRLVRLSLQNPETQGRVALYAECVNNSQGHPLGFYYKLGFRSIDAKINDACKQWLLHGGGKETSPGINTYPGISMDELKTGIMYLPPENIEYCLKYGYKKLRLSSQQIEVADKNCDYLDEILE